MKSYFERNWRRSQLEDALWKYCSTVQHWGAGNRSKAAKAPLVFSSRVKKLLNLDRATKLDSDPRLGAVEWIFFDEAGGGRGSEDLFSDFQVFAMWMALRLLDIGFKQMEVIFFLRHMLTHIKGQYSDIREEGIAGHIKAPVMETGRQKQKATSYDKAPAIRLNEHEFADFPVFMTVRRIEMKETFFDVVPPDMRNSEPLIMPPQFHYGHEALKETMFSDRNSYTAFAVLEVADAALSLSKFLEETPARGRGRRVN